MVENRAKRYPQVDPVKFARIIKKTREVANKHTLDRVKLGEFFYSEFFDNDLSQAIHYGNNNYYRALIDAVIAGEVGSATHSWIKTNMHTYVMGLCLKAEGLDEDWLHLPYSHKSAFVGIGFNHSDFVQKAASLVRTNSWPLAMLRVHLRAKRLDKGDSVLTPSKARSVIRHVVSSGSQAHITRTAAKMRSYRGMFSHFDDDGFSALDSNSVKDLARFAKDYNDEKKARSKRKGKTK